MFDRLKIDPGHRTLGELLQERQWAVQEISRLKDEVARLNARRDGVSKRTHVNADTLPAGPSDPLAGRRLLRLADVKKLVGFSTSSIYKLISEGRFPDRIHYGARAVRWREEDIIAWQNSPASSTRSDRRQVNSSFMLLARNRVRQRRIESLLPGLEACPGSVELAQIGLTV